MSHCTLTGSILHLETVSTFAQENRSTGKARAKEALRTTERGISLDHDEVEHVFMAMKDGDLVGLPRLWRLARRATVVLRNTDSDCRF